MSGLAELSATYNILLIEDDGLDREIVRRNLARADEAFIISDHSSLQEGIESLKRQDADAVLLDLSLPDSFGMGTIHRLLEVSASCPVIILSGNEDKAFAREAIRAGIQDYLIKGELSASSLSRAITFAIERKRSAE